MWRALSMADDGQTQRERRAERARAKRTDRTAKPADWGARWNTMRGPLIILVIVAAAVGAVVLLSQANEGGECPGHWHATQVVFVPNGQKNPDGKDLPTRVDWSTPKATSGRQYYDFGVAPKMTLTIHMHQTGPEVGEGVGLGPSQFHFEGDKCIGVQNAYKAIDLDVSEGRMSLVAGSPLAANHAAVNPGNAGPWVANDTARLRMFLLESVEDHKWAWREADVGDHMHYQLPDGASMALIYGDYSDRQIQDMLDQTPAGNNARLSSDEIVRWYTPPATTTATTSESSSPSAAA